MQIRNVVTFKSSSSTLCLHPRDLQAPVAVNKVPQGFCGSLSRFTNESAKSRFSRTYSSTFCLHNRSMQALVAVNQVRQGFCRSLSLFANANLISRCLQMSVLRFACTLAV